MTQDLSPLGARLRRADPDRFLAALFAPAERRETLFLLGAVNDELARAREVASLPMIALIRLQWWREIAEGTRRRHEVAGPLGAALDAGLLDAADLLAMIEGREVETDETVPDLAAFRAYVEATAGGHAAAAGRLLGADAPTIARLRSLGTAYGVAGVLRSVPALARAGRCLLPEDVLADQRLTVHDVIARPAAFDPTPLRAEAARLLAAGSGRFPRAIIAAALPAVLARRDLARPAPRGLAARLAVVAAYMIGRV
jgi:phytoene synthase